MGFVVPFAHHRFFCFINLCYLCCLQQRAKVWQQHHLKNAGDKIVQLNVDLLKLHGDTDLAMKDELNNIKGLDMFSTFYTSLNATREYYQKFPNLDHLATPHPKDAILQIPFSGEEVFGKYLDLTSFHLKFNNLSKKLISEQDYLQFLDRFNSFFYIPSSVKATAAYNDYLTELWQYLHDFFARVNPLISLDGIMQLWAADYDSKHAENSSDGGGKGNTRPPEPLRLGMFGCAEELHALGMDRLKEALEALGLKCGGTLSDRAARLWSVRGKKPEDFPPSLRAKTARPQERNASDGALIGSKFYSWAGSVSAYITPF